MRHVTSNVLFGLLAITGVVGQLTAWTLSGGTVGIRPLAADNQVPCSSGTVATPVFETTSATAVLNYGVDAVSAADLDIFWFAGGTPQGTGRPPHTCLFSLPP